MEFVRISIKKGQDERKRLLIRGNTRELIGSSSVSGTILREHLSSATIFNGTFKNINTEILDRKPCRVSSRS